MCPHGGPIGHILIACAVSLPFVGPILIAKYKAWKNKRGK